MAQSLTSEEEVRLEEFLRPPLIAVVATVGRSGMPQLTPNWYHFGAGKMSISTTKERVKYRNLVRDGRLAVCVYSGTMAEQYTTIIGRAEINDDDSIWPLTQAIAERYVSPERAEPLIRQFRTENRVIISLTPDRVIFLTQRLPH